MPQDILDQLKKLKAEIVEVEDIKGGIAGMFWRFLVADDPTVNSSCPIAFVLLPACLDTPIIIIISFLSFST